MSGDARIIGRPANATVFTDGHLNSDLTLYIEKTFWDGKKANDYILSLKQFDEYGMLKYINIELTYKWIGIPASNNIADYDTIAGYLFQSDVSYHSSDFRNNMDGFDFDPHLQFTDREIKFNIPPGRLKYNSVLIVLN